MEKIKRRNFLHPCAQSLPIMEAPSLLFSPERHWQQYLWHIKNIQMIFTCRKTLLKMFMIQEIRNCLAYTMLLFLNDVWFIMISDKSKNYWVYFVSVFKQFQTAKIVIFVQKGFKGRPQLFLALLVSSQTVSLPKVTSFEKTQITFFTTTLSRTAATTIMKTASNYCTCFGNAYKMYHLFQLHPLHCLNKSQFQNWNLSGNQAVM